MLQCFAISQSQTSLLHSNSTTQQQYVEHTDDAVFLLSHQPESMTPSLTAQYHLGQPVGQSTYTHITRQSAKGQTKYLEAIHTSVHCHQGKQSENAPTHFG